MRVGLFDKLNEFVGRLRPLCVVLAISWNDQKDGDFALDIGVAGRHTITTCSGGSPCRGPPAPEITQAAWVGKVRARSESGRRSSDAECINNAVANVSSATG